MNRDQHTPRVGRALLATATTFVGIIAIGAFGLSFNALQDLAVRSGIAPSIAWLWPVIVDGFIITAMLVIFAWRGAPGRVTAWPWIAFGLFACISIAGNAIHTSVVVTDDAGIHVGVAMAVGAVPPVALLLASEMVVRIAAGKEAAHANTGNKRDDAPASEPTPDPEPRLEVPDTVPTEWPELSQPHVAVSLAESEPKPVSTVAHAAITADDTARATTTPSSIALPNDTSDTAMADPIDSTNDNASDSPIADTQEPAIVIDERGNATQPEATEPRPRAKGWTPELITGGGIPSDTAGQIAWIVERAQRSEDVTASTLAELLDLSLRTAHRRLSAAKKAAPEIFSDSELAAADRSAQ